MPPAAPVSRLVVASGAAALVWLPFRSLDTVLAGAGAALCLVAGLVFAFWPGERPLLEQLLVWAHYATLP